MASAEVECEIDRRQQPAGGDGRVAAAAQRLYVSSGAIFWRCLSHAISLYHLRAFYVSSIYPPLAWRHRKQQQNGWLWLSGPRVVA